MNSAYLFSGILKCSECGANLTILWGKGSHKSSQVYGCSSDWLRGASVCKNAARIRRDDAEKLLLTNLQEKILTTDVIQYVMQKFETGMLKELANMSSEIDAMQTRKRELESELENLTKALATGQLSPSPTIMKGIAERKAEISSIAERVISSSESSIKERVKIMTETAKNKLTNLRSQLSGDVVVAREALRQHINEITMEADGKLYAASGKWNLLGVRPTDGAGGPDSTTRVYLQPSPGRMMSSS